MTTSVRNDVEQVNNLYWAKYDPDTGLIHRLEHHLADVSAVMQRLLQIPGIRRATAKAGHLNDLDPTNAARLCVFAALHDIGKTNLEFQAKRTRKGGASHTKDMMQLLNGEDVKNQERFLEAIPWLNDAMSRWDRNDGNTVCSLIIAMLSHHGKPEELNNGHYPRSNHWQDARPHGRQQPFEKIREIAHQVQGWFPEAFRQEAPTLPENPEYQHHFLGLLMLADWIGSDTRWFPFRPEPDPQYISTACQQARTAVKTIGLDTTEQKTPETPATLEVISGKSNTRPNAMQRAITKADPLEPVVILESETGSGKTEAALLRFQLMMRKGLVDGIYFALPTRAAATQIHRRITAAIKQILPDAGIEPVLALPGYVRAGEHDGITLQRYRVHWEDHPDEGSRWSAESSKRFLTAQVAVGTIDQAMLSVMQTRHAHLRAACLSRNLLVIDEVHASDTYMQGIIQALVRNHTLKGGHTLMMSATLGSAARTAYLGQPPQSLSEARTVMYPCIATQQDIVATGGNERQKEVHVSMLPAGENSRAAVQEALNAQRKGAKALVIRNTVRTAIETAKALESLVDNPSEVMLTLNSKPTLHHSRFATEDRKLLDAVVEQYLSPDTSGKGVIIVGTQTLEQSLDIDADYLITDLCPMDVLLQRIGRLHRRQSVPRPDAYRKAQCVVLMPEDSIIRLIGRQSTNGLGPEGRVYRDLRVIEATKRQIEANPVWQLPDMNRALVENSTHPEKLRAITEEEPEVWYKHRNDMDGESSADRLQSENVLIKWDAPFYDGETGNNDSVLFKDNRAMTRLADPRIDVDFPPGTTGPFGNEITGISIPYWIIGEQVADLQDATATILQNQDGVITFRIADSGKLEYSRYGLTQAP